MKDDGCLKRKGDRLINQKLAITLERISNDPDSFYTGNLAKDIINDISSHQGIITNNDLENYSVEIKKAINASIGDHKLFTTGLPSSGILLTFILNVLKGRFLVVCQSSFLRRNFKRYKNNIFFNLISAALSTE